jgi:hypothetical protein
MEKEREHLRSDSTCSIFEQKVPRTEPQLNPGQAELTEQCFLQNNRGNVLKKKKKC